MFLILVRNKKTKTSKCLRQTWLKWSKWSKWSKCPRHTWSILAASSTSWSWLVSFTMDWSFTFSHVSMFIEKDIYIYEDRIYMKIMEQVGNEKKASQWIFSPLSSAGSTLLLAPTWEEKKLNVEIEKRKNNLRLLGGTFRWHFWLLDNIYHVAF